MKRHTWVTTGVLVLGLLLPKNTAVFHPLAPAGPRPSKSASAAVYADTRVQDVHMIEQSLTHTTWEVFVREAVLYRAQQRARVSQLRAHLFRNAAGVLVLTADEGELYLGTGDLTVWGHVRLQQQQVYTLTTQRLRWLAAPHLLRTEARVSLRNATVSIIGKGLIGDVDRQRFTLTEEVQASFRLP